MDNSENKPLESSEPNSASNAPQAAESNAQAQTSNESALPTYDALNANQSVVTPDVIEARIQAARARNANGDGPLAARARKSAERSNAENGEKAVKGENGDQRGGRPPRERRERRDARPTATPRAPLTSVPVPNRREGLGGDLEEEFNAIMGEGFSLDAAMDSISENLTNTTLEQGTKAKARVASINRDTVFVDLGVREFGAVPLKQFPEETVLEPGAEVEVVVQKFNTADGVYEASLPMAAADAADWASLTKGAIVEAVVSKVNTGGLECMVGKLRAFMPMGQIALNRVDNPEVYVNERLRCVITEINPQRRNLVVSARELLKKEREEKSAELWPQLAVGQTREGVVLRVFDFGVFVDMGGVDAFVPAGEIAWKRVKHPSEAVSVGDRVSVTLIRIDEDKQKVTATLRRVEEDPWNSVSGEISVGDVFTGAITKVESYGAFVTTGVEGVEGLVHVSEIDYRRVNSATDVLKAGESVVVKVISIDDSKRRIGLSMKQVKEDPREVAKREAEAQDAAKAKAEDEAAEKRAAETRERIKKLNLRNQNLQGGLGNREENEFGLHF